jgi:hypothetical protein
VRANQMVRANQTAHANQTALAYQIVRVNQLLCYIFSVVGITMYVDALKKIILKVQFFTY